jgi:hypothetical protein
MFIVVDDVATLVGADRNAMRRLAETAVFCSVAPRWTATAQRGNDASKLDQGRRWVFFIRPGALWS